MKKLLFPFLCLILIWFGFTACNTENAKLPVNPHAPGFDLEGSDPEAIAIADDVMTAMGGRGAWDSTTYIQWNFFGRRILSWDKQGKRCRIEIPAEKSVYLIDLESRTGQVSRDGSIMSHPDSIQKFVQRGYEIWINDSYWLVMPFKLKDSGVTLRYEGKDTTENGLTADVLQLTFKNVGVTPDNKYLVYVDDASRLVSQWKFYSTYSDSIPRFTTPWSDYARNGGILLSGNRGRFALTDIQVFDEMDEKVFSDLEPMHF